MLVVSEVSPGPADGQLHPGDLVLRVGGEWCTSFVRLEEALDSNVGGTCALDVCRGGVVQAVSVRVDDLHAITPGRFFEVGGGIMNELSYQQARARRSFPCLHVDSVLVLPRGTGPQD